MLKLEKTRCPFWVVVGRRHMTNPLPAGRRQLATGILYYYGYILRTLCNIIIILELICSIALSNCSSQGKDAVTCLLQGRHWTAADAVFLTLCSTPYCDIYPPIGMHRPINMWTTFHQEMIISTPPVGSETAGSTGYYYCLRQTRTCGSHLGQVTIE